MRDAQVRKKKIRETRKQIEKAKRYLFTNGVQNDDVALFIDGLQDQLYYDYLGKKQWRRIEDFDARYFFNFNYAITVALHDNRDGAKNYEYDRYFDSEDEAMKVINNEKDCFLTPESTWVTNKDGKDLLKLIGSKTYVREKRTYKKVLTLSLRSLANC